MALTERDKKMLIVLGVVAGLAVLYFLFTMLTGGGDDADPAAGAGATDVTTGSPTDAPTAGEVPVVPEESPSPVTTIPTAEGPVLSGRDFFSPLPEILASPTTSPTDGTSPAPVDTVDNSTTIDGQDVTLEAIVERKKGDEVNMSVDGNSWPKLGVGDTFAKFYTVNTIDSDDGCADFQFDKKGSAESFKLCL